MVCGERTDIARPAGLDAAQADASAELPVGSFRKSSSFAASLLDENQVLKRLSLLQVKHISHPSFWGPLSRAVKRPTDTDSYKHVPRKAAGIRVIRNHAIGKEAAIGWEHQWQGACENQWRQQ